MQLELNVYNFNLGVKAFKEKRYSDSIEYYTKSIQENPLISFSKAYFWRGIANYFEGNYTNAIDDLNEASMAIQNDIRIFNWRGLSYKLTEQYKKAKSDFIKLIELEPKFREAYVELYELGFLTNDIELANQYFHKLIKIDRSGINLFIQRADEISKSEEYELAIKMCEFLTKKVGDESNSILIKGTCNANLKNYGLALKDFDKYIELNPNHYIGYFNRAVLFNQTNEKLKANADFRKAYDLGLEDALKFIDKENE